MSDEQQAPVPVPVHITGMAAGVKLGTARPQRHSVYHTATLIASDPAQDILPASDHRVKAWILAIDADIWIGPNQSDVAVGAGAYVPCVVPTATKPNLNAWTPIDDYRAIYAAPVSTLNGSSKARVSVIAIYEE